MARFRASLGRILTIGGLATATGAVAVYRSELTDRAAAYAQQFDSSAVQVVEDVQKPVLAAWDNDWDRRGAFVDLTKSIGRRRVNSSDEKNSYITIDSSNETVYKREESDELQKKQPRATRHLIFVRHGQYNSGKKLDEDRRLTDLGRFVHSTGIILFGRFSSSCMTCFHCNGESCHTKASWKSSREVF